MVLKQKSKSLATKKIRNRQFKKYNSFFNQCWDDTFHDDEFDNTIIDYLSIDQSLI